MNIDKIEIKDVDGELKIVYKRDIITNTFNKISTKAIALDTLKYAIRRNFKTGTLYAGIDTKVADICFSDKPFNTNTIINVFSLNINNMLYSNKSLEELYYDNFEGFNYIFDVEEQLDKLYNQDFRRCECDGVMDNISIEDEYVYEAGYEYRGVDSTVRTLYFRCRDCNKEDSYGYIYRGLV